MANWQLNRKLQTFLTTLQNLLDSSNLIPLNSRSPVYPQEFKQKSIADHHQIEIQSTPKQIDEELIHQAQQKYLSSNSDYWIKSRVSNPTLHEDKQFPAEIFSSIDDQHSDLSEIGNHFKSQLANSWKQWQSTMNYQGEYPSKEEITQLLVTLEQQSARFWKELVESLTTSNAQLFHIGLLPRITPAVLLTFFEQI